MHTCRGQSDYGKEIKQMLKVFLFVFLLLINEYRTKTRYSGDALHYEKDEGQGRRGGGDQRLEVRCHGDRPTVSDREAALAPAQPSIMPSHQHLSAVRSTQHQE